MLINCRKNNKNNHNCRGGLLLCRAKWPKNVTTQFNAINPKREYLCPSISKITVVGENAITNLKTLVADSSLQRQGVKHSL